MFPCHPSRLGTRGVSRSSRHARRDAVGAPVCSMVIHADEHSGAHGEIVWSWPPGAEVKPALRRARRRRGQERRSPGRTRISRKAIAQGRPGDFGCTCGSAACFFAARGPWAPAGARPSPRPLFPEGGVLAATRAQSAPRERIHLSLKARFFVACGGRRAKSRCKYDVYRTVVSPLLSAGAGKRPVLRRFDVIGPANLLGWWPCRPPGERPVRVDQPISATSPFVPARWA
jgi:hypothetical protein